MTSDVSDAQLGWPDSRGSSWVSFSGWGGATAYAVAQFTERGGSGAGGEGRASVSDRLAGNWHRVPSPHPHMATVKARGKAVHRQGEGNVLRSW